MTNIQLSVGLIAFLYLNLHLNIVETSQDLVPDTSDG